MRIPIWLLGSSGFSARLAGQLGLPFAFAGHFSPEYILPALKLYRETFEPSDDLEKPYAMLAINLIAADTDEEAQFLATTQFQSFLRLARGTPGQMQPPVENMDDIWTPQEKAAVESRLGGSIIGSPATVKTGLERILAETAADELMLNAMIFDHASVSVLMRSSLMCESSVLPNCTRSGPINTLEPPDLAIEYFAISKSQPNPKSQIPNPKSHIVVAGRFMGDVTTAGAHIAEILIFGIIAGIGSALILPIFAFVPFNARRDNRMTSIVLLGFVIVCIVLVTIAFLSVADGLSKIQPPQQT